MTSRSPRRGGSCISALKAAPGWRLLLREASKSFDSCYLQELPKSQLDHPIVKHRRSWLGLLLGSEETVPRRVAHRGRQPMASGGFRVELEVLQQKSQYVQNLVPQIQSQL